MLHDTHAHLDLLLQKLGYLPDKNDLDLEHGSLKHISEFELDKTRVEDMVKMHEFIINPSVSTDNFSINYTLFHSFSQIFLLLGSHPEIVNEKFSVEKYLDDQRDVIVQIESDQAMFSKLLGIGEVGLDYHYTQDSEIKQKQISLFEEQIRLALKLKLPLVIHCREAFDDLIEVLKEYPSIHNHFLVHCFTENTEILRKVLDLGGKIGVGGVVTFKSAPDLQEAVKYCPDSSYMLETDLPFLAPVPHRGNLCTPDMISVIAEKVADLKRQEVELVWKNSLKNIQALFKIIV